jgi:hypothetical protein
MGTQLRQWAIRVLATVALPIMLTLGLGAAANAQPVLASHVSSTGHPSAHHAWDVYGPYYYHDDCSYAQYEFGGPRSYCEVRYRHDGDYEYWVWYLYVPNCGCNSPYVKD